MWTTPLSTIEQRNGVVARRRYAVKRSFFWYSDGNDLVKKKNLMYAMMQKTAETILSRLGSDT